MTARRTSAETYRAIEADGTLGRLQWLAYDLLYQHGPLTAKELGRQSGRDGIWKRLSELEERGLAVEVGERACRVTGRQAIVWDVTDELPRPVDKKVVQSSRKRIQELENRIQELEAENDYLFQQVRKLKSRDSTQTARAG